MKVTNEYLNMLKTFDGLTLEQKVKFINNECDILSKSNQIERFEILKIKTPIIIEFKLKEKDTVKDPVTNQYCIYIYNDEVKVNDIIVRTYATSHEDAIEKIKKNLPYIEYIKF